MFNSDLHALARTLDEGRGELGMDRMHGWIGRKERRAIAGDAVVRRDDGTQVHVKVGDVSDEGCRIECGEDGFRIGEWINITMPTGGDVKAQVRWALGSSAGVKFETIDEA